MFDYEKFKAKLKEQFIHHMSLPFADGEVVFTVKEKDGVQREGFYIKRQGFFLVVCLFSFCLSQSMTKFIKIVVMGILRKQWIISLYFMKNNLSRL